MKLFILFAAASLASTVALAVDHPVHEGKWEITSTTTMPGMGTMPPRTHTQCITRKDPVPHQDSQHAKNCKTLDQKMKGSTVTWKVQCEGSHGPVNGTGTITYGSGTFDGHMTFNMVNPRTHQPMEVTTTM